MAQLTIGFRRTMKWLFAISGLFAGLVTNAFFLTGYPSFGKSPSDERLSKIKQSP